MYTLEDIELYKRLAELMKVVPGYADYATGWYAWAKKTPAFDKGKSPVDEVIPLHKFAVNQRVIEYCLIPPLSWLVRELRKLIGDTWMLMPNSIIDLGAVGAEIVKESWEVFPKISELPHATAPTPEGAVLRALIKVLEVKR